MTKPVGLNVLTAAVAPSVYAKRMPQYVDAALEEGVELFVTVLGNLWRWVVDVLEERGGVVDHDVIDRRCGEGRGQGRRWLDPRARGGTPGEQPEELDADLADL